MKGQKQSRTDLLEKTVNAQNRVLEHVLKELTNVTDLAIGTLETVKQMPDYENAIDKLKTKVAEESSKAEKAKP